ncbi:MAG TPA: filamentous hemagglutinin N-terminal domain-containing protein, partial [Leptolyngbyaceae cyanobacterium]
MNFCGIQKILLVITSGAIAYGVYPILPVQAQSITTTPNNDTNTIININGNKIDIDGGTLSPDQLNLFHSFQKFGLESSEIANFISSPNIQNILGRVLGGDPSVIKGLIQVSGGNANLYLLNPAGFIFGSDASLNVPGDFIASTANSVGIGTSWFNVFGSNDYSTLVGTPTSFSFNPSQPGSIVNFGNLQVKTGANLRLIGSTVVSTGQLSASEGNITLAAVPGEKLLRISQPGNLLSLEVPTNIAPTGNITVATLAKLLTNTGFQNTGGLTVNANEQVQLTSTGSLINSGDGVVTGITAGSASLLAAQNLTLPNQITILGNLSTNSTGTTKFASTVQAASLSTSGGNTEINGNITTTGAQTYNSDVQLTGDIVLTANEIDFLGGNASVSGSGKLTLQPFTSIQNIVVNGNEGTTALDISSQDFAALDNGLSSLVIGANNGSGKITINPSTVKSDLEVRSPNGTIEVSNLNVDGNASFNATQTNIDSDITTTGAQTYNSNVKLNNSVELSTTNSAVTFNRQVESQNTTQDLTVNAGTGNITFNDAVGSTTALGNLSTNSTGTTKFASTVQAASLSTSGGNTEINGNITTTGNIQLNSPITLTGGGSKTFNSNNNNIGFNSTVNGASNLTLNAGTGNISFSGAVGETTALTGLSTTAANTNVANNITTTGNIQFNSPVTLTGGGSKTFNSNNNNIGFGSTVNGASNLTLNAGTGNISFSGAVGETTALTGLSTNADNTNVANNITTTGNIQFNSPVTLTGGGSKTFNSNNNNIGFGSTVNGASNL